MWRVAKTEDSSTVIAVVESWDWIHYLVEEDMVDYNYQCMSQDYKCIPQISYNHHCINRCSDGKLAK